jgi:hypothetical protein
MWVFGCSGASRHLWRCASGITFGSTPVGTLGALVASSDVFVRDQIDRGYGEGETAILAGL